jgi:hypothetical protein
MVESAGVPSGTGVAAFESEAFSAAAAELGWTAAGVLDVVGEPLSSSLVWLAWPSSSTGSAAISFLRAAGETVRVTTKVGLLLPDLRRASMALPLGAMIETCIEVMTVFVTMVLQTSSRIVKVSQSRSGNECKGQKWVRSALCWIAVVGWVNKRGRCRVLLGWSEKSDFFRLPKPSWGRRLCRICYLWLVVMQLPWPMIDDQGGGCRGCLMVW